MATQYPQYPPYDPYKQPGAYQTEPQNPPPSYNYATGHSPAQPQYNYNTTAGGAPPGGQNPYADPFLEGGLQSFSDIKIRHAFIRKVYAILSLQLAVTVGFIALFIFVEPVKGFFRQNYWIHWLLLAGTFIIIIVLACCESVTRKYPLNMILLAAFTLMESILLGSISAHYDIDTVLIAAGITAVVVVAITIFSFQTKIDFTGAGIYLFVAILLLLVFGIICAIIRNRIANIVYAALGAGIFSMYLIFDTQLMLGMYNSHN